MKVYASISKRRLRIGGEQHSGWLPEGAAKPLPTPVRELNFEFKITDDGGGNFLLCYNSEDGSVYGDTWHVTMDEAIQVAREEFGIQSAEWHFSDSEKGAGE